MKSMAPLGPEFKALIEHGFVEFNKAPLER
jgi:hypothetical protein